MGKDHTLFATMMGTVQFVVKGAKNRTYANIVPYANLATPAVVAAA